MKRAKNTKLLAHETALETIKGQSNQGEVSYALTSENESFRNVIKELVQENDFRCQDPSRVRAFMRLMASFWQNQEVNPAEMTKEVLFSMLLHIKRAARSAHEMRFVVAMGMYYARFCATRYGAFADNPVLLEAIKGKELIAFINDSYSGGNVVMAKCTSKDSRLAFFELKYHNDYLNEIYQQYLERGFSNRSMREILMFYRDFESSLEEYAGEIHSIEDFSGNTFWTQVTYALSRRNTSAKEKKEAVHNVIDFYRFVVNEPGGDAVFKKCPNMSSVLIAKPGILELIVGGYSFLPIGEYPSDIVMRPITKAAIVLKGENSTSISIRKTEDEVAAINLSGIKDDERRILLWKYLFNQKEELIHSQGYLIEALSRLEYGNNVVTEKIARQIRYDFACRLTETSLGTALKRCKRFFRWAQDNAGWRIKPLAWSFFSEKRNARRNKTSYTPAIPIEHLAAVLDYLGAKKDRSLYDKHCYVATLLLSTTPLRSSEVFRINVTTMELIEAKGYGVIRGIRKTTKDETDALTITILTLRELQQLLAETAELRDKCPNESLRNYLFIYYRRGFGFLRLNSDSFGEMLADAFSAIGLPRWSPSNLRHLFATYADRYDHEVTKSGGVRVAQIMGHSNYDMTNDNYIDHTVDAFTNLAIAENVGTEKDIMDQLAKLEKKKQDKDENTVSR